MSESIIDLTESSPPPVEHSRTPSAKAVLQSAIDSAQPTRLRATLQALCNSSADVASLVSSLLLVPENEVKKSRHRKASSEDSDEDEDEEDSDKSSNGSEEEEEENGDNLEDTEATSNTLKRLRPRYAMCENCSEEFDVTDNVKGACVYHDEYMEPDDDAFADHDEDCHGPIDTSEMRDMYPECFIYTCCDQDGLSVGCKTGRHLESKAIYKRPRY